MEILNSLGSGIYGNVFKALDTQTGSIVALKVFKEIENNTGEYEIQILRHLLTHPNIIKIWKSFYYKGKLSMSMDYMKMNLCNYINAFSKRGKKIPRDGLRSIAFQLLRGLDYIHRKGIVHLDIKPQNILITPSLNTVKLCDFGISEKLPFTNKDGLGEVVTLWYRPLEIILRKPGCTTATDVWSLGCVFAELVLGEPIFSNRTELGMLFDICQILGRPTEEYIGKDNYWKLPKWNKNYLAYTLRSCPHPQFVDLIQRMICLHPHDRITAQNALKHPFFK